MSILDDLMGLIVPHSCLVCGAEGRLLCDACTNLLTPAAELCYLCQQPAKGGFSCLKCASAVSRVRVSTTYTGSAKALIWQIKLNGAQAAGRLMARQMAHQLNDEDNELLLVPVPTATSRVRQRGYDQARLLARELNRQTGLPYLDCLARHGQTHQHGTSRQERLLQLESAFRVKNSRTVQNKHILLIDDVVTTGATLTSAAQVIKNTGARYIEALVFARPN